ncbi:hypothetical protein F511_16467 [Dorcoceras hygrometricum]|uniref:Uncharacterized protein n=1 Tax=Dorcoceras hygrometricum TaxID=472368 RepID=A0A2Z7D5K1_9LAMI|nr:hypothetical protein F511_16467 [Dorcoceras hygrometricum]
MSRRGRERTRSSIPLEETESDNNVNITQLLRMLVEQNNNRGNGQSSSSRGPSNDDPQEKFRRQKPKEFSGTTDPLVAESWIKSMEITLISGILSFVILSEMASSLISNTNQVHFASVLAMDNAEMVAMFEALVASGLNGFLGCMSDIFETALIEFYQNASVRDGKVVSAVQGKLVEISEEIFARTFQLPVFRGVPSSENFTAKTVGRYIAINDKIFVENVEGLAGKSRVKKTPVKRAVSKKRPAVAVDEQVVKKKRTLKGKAAPSKAKLKLVSVALDAEPIQTIDPTSADDVDTNIEKVVADTAPLETDVGSPVVQKADEMEQWFNLSYEEIFAREAEKLVETGSDSDGETETVACGTVVEKQPGEGGSSSRPQPPPDDQDRPSGGSTGRGNRGGESGGDGGRRGDRSGSSKRRRPDSGGSGSGTGRITYGVMPRANYSR